MVLQLLSLESKCKDFQVNISALREEISERDTVIAQNYTTIQLLRRRLADMEKHKFVLGYRTQVCPFSPAACALSHLQSTVSLDSGFELLLQRFVMMWYSRCMPCKGDVRSRCKYTHLDDTALSALTAHSFHCKPTVCCHVSLSTYHSPRITLQLSLSTYHPPTITVQLVKLRQSTAHVSHLPKGA